MFEELVLFISFLFPTPPLCFGRDKIPFFCTVVVQDIGRRVSATCNRGELYCITESLVVVRKWSNFFRVVRDCSEWFYNR